MSNLLCRTPAGQRARTCVITRPTLVLQSLRYCSTGTTFEKVPSISSSVAKSQATEKPSSAPPHSVLPTKTLLRSLLVTTISSHQALLVPCLSILSFLTKPRGVLLDVDRNPLIHWFLKKSFYDHFCAGEKESQVRDKIRQIKSTGLRGVILTYARETVQDSSTNQTQFAHSQVSQKATDTESCEYIAAWREGYLKTVDMLGEGDFLAPKLTGAGPRVTEAFASGQPVPTQMVETLDEVCQRVVEKNARLLMDAEQHSFLQGIHNLTLDMMRKYNRNGKAVVYNTYQAYLKSTPSTIASHMEIADQEGFTFGLKLVRGAYMRSDPRQLIHDTKQDTDIAYNSIVRGVLQQRYQGFGESGRRFPTTDLFLATHNIESAVAAHELHQARLQAGLPTGRVEFGQLLGMADGVSFGLLQLKDQNNVAPGVYKCLTWGSMGECLGYLVRRAAENRDAVTRTMTEHLALKAEVKRRVRAFFG
ncbi:proline dehydrogenase [Aspergillus niger]|nr:proline dehydrogenase [Aspergillus niger]